MRRTKSTEGGHSCRPHGRFENPPSVPSDGHTKWQDVEFPAAIKKTMIGKQNQIPTADILPSGQFPVVDQGQAFIAGYSDAAERVIRDGLPLVIFGDHTRCLKFVNFPFILGADGTKVLKPREDLFDAKFFYYALLSLDIPNRGYNRHFTLLKEKKVPHEQVNVGNNAS